MTCAGAPDSGRTLTLRTVLEPRGPAAAVLLSEEQLAAIGAGKRSPPVRVTVNGHTFRGRLGRMGGEIMLGFNRANRAACGVEPGDEIEVAIAPDEAPRDVEVPPDLAAALAGDADVRLRFDGLAYSHRKEFARWVGEAKRPETRKRRVAETLAMVREGRTR